MKFIIITHVKHIEDKDQYFGYAPYVREMNIWLKYADEVIIVAPLLKTKPTTIDIAYEHQKIDFKKVSNLSFTSFRNNWISIFKLPIVFWKIFWAMNKADHIHLRCPGNIGLLGTLLQIFFPFKVKTAKYAGNWDPSSKQPLSYRLQRWILSNTLLTKNMKVLVYGEWPNQSKNIQPFFTATYLESEKKNTASRQFDSLIELIFVGTLSKGKRPLYAVQLSEELLNRGIKVILRLYGEGEERKNIENYIVSNRLDHAVFLMGNKTKEEVQEAYQKSHCLILPSKSEGWPKAVAEAMFWGCVPVATKVSCVPNMLNNELRGLLLNMDLASDTSKISTLIADTQAYYLKSKKAEDWSRTYTLDYFESKIQKLLKP